MTRHRRRPAHNRSSRVNDRLDALYAELPPIECRGKCQDSCGPIDMSDAERIRIRGRGVEIPRVTRSCPALTMFGACGVYDIRPMVCRLWGLVESLPCPYGCRPDGGLMSDADGYRLIEASIRTGGRPASLGPPSSPQAAAIAMSDPRTARFVHNVLRARNGDS